MIFVFFSLKQNCIKSIEDGLTDISNNGKKGRYHYQSAKL